jgi:hypothetical protein
VPVIDSQVAFLVADSFVGAVDHPVPNPGPMHIVLGDPIAAICCWSDRAVRMNFAVGYLAAISWYLHERPRVVLESVVSRSMLEERVKVPTPPVVSQLSACDIMPTRSSVAKDGRGIAN